MVSGFVVLWWHEVAHMDMSLEPKDPVIGHGKCNFMKEEKVAKLLRESGGLERFAFPNGWLYVLRAT